MRVFCITLIVLGVVGLKFFSPEGGGTAHPKTSETNPQP